MRPDDLWTALRFGLLPLVGFAVLASLLIHGAARLARIREPSQFVLLFVFSLLGGILGFSTGNSREPAVAALLSGVLTLITLLLGYAFGKEQTTAKQLIPYCMLAVLLTSSYGLFTGTVVRVQSEDYATAQARELAHEREVNWPIEKETRLRQLPPSTATAATRPDSAR